MVLATVALVAIVMLAAAQTLRRGEHIGVDLLVTRLAAPGRRWAQVWAALATGVIAIVLVINGWGTSQLARRLGLLTPRVRDAFAQMDILRFEHGKDSVEEPEVTPPEELVSLLTSFLQGNAAAQSPA